MDGLNPIHGLRWIMVLPAAFAGYTLAIFICSWITAFTPDWTQLLLSNAVAPIALLYCGVIMAPGYRWNVGWLLFTITTAMTLWIAVEHEFSRVLVLAILLSISAQIFFMSRNLPPNFRSIVEQ